MGRENDGKFNRMYNVNHNFFDIIDSEEKAYILGFLYADGTNMEVINGQNGISFTQLEQDIDILNKINVAMQSTYPINSYIQKSNGKVKCKLTFCSQKLSDQVNFLGAPPKKSLILKFPNKEIFKSPDLIRHFIRGYFDGDGCI